MRPYWGPPARSYGAGETPAVYALLSFMGIVFIADWALHGALTELLAWPVMPSWWHGLPLGAWQPFTFPFAHGANFLYLITDGIVLYFFGGSLERAWGSGKFLFFFFASGIVAGLVICALGLFMPVLALFLGMTGGFVAMVVAFAALDPYATVLLIIFPMQARWLGVLSVAWELFGRSNAYGGPAQAVAGVGAAVLFAYLFTTQRWSLRSLRGPGGPSLKERMERWQQKRRMRAWQRRVAKADKPEDLFKK